MMGFVLKDFYLLRKQLLYLLFMGGVYTVLTLLGIMPPSVLPAIVLILSLIAPMNAFGFDDLARWDKFAAATPAGRRGIVAGRYLFVVLLLLVSMVLIAALVLVFSILRLSDTSLVELLAAIPICAVLGLLANAVMMPLLYKFGSERARVISVALFAAVFGGIASVGLISVRYGKAIPDRFLLLAGILLAVASILGFFLSYRLSLRIFSRKEL